MKNLAFIALLLFSTSCQKETVAPVTNLKASILSMTFKNETTTSLPIQLYKDIVLKNNTLTLVPDSNCPNSSIICSVLIFDNVESFYVKNETSIKCF